METSISLNGQKILLVTDAWLPQVNGVVTTLNTIYELCNMQVFHPELVKYIKFPFYKEIPLCYTFKGLKEYIKNAEYIHIATEGPLGLYAKLYCDFKGYKYTTGYHTNFDQLLKDNYNIPFFITNFFIKFFHNKSEKILVPSLSTAIKLNSINLNNTIIWTRGVTQNFVFNDELVKLNKILRLLYVGRISKEKNIKNFLDTEIGIPHKKIVIGDGPMLRQYQKEYLDVNFLGTLVGDQLVKEYQKANVFVFPSRFDTFGLVQIEAMYCGTPVAAYNVPGPEDVIDQNRTGYISNNLKYSILKCLHLDRKSVAKRAREMWSWDACLDIFISSLVKKER